MGTPGTPNTGGDTTASPTPAPETTPSLTAPFVAPTTIGAAVGNGAGLTSTDTTTSTEATTREDSAVNTFTASPQPSLTPALPTNPETQSQTGASSTGESGSNPSPSPSTTGQNIFSTGAVTFRFDDGVQSQYDVAFPALQAAGFRGTFYIVTRQLSDQGFPGYMSSAEVKQLASAGEEIGDHTQSHPHLPTLSSSQQQAEIAGGKQDLEAMGISPTSFSYPYGEYTSATVQSVKDAGLSSAVTTVETAASQSSDPFQIESPSLQRSDTASRVEQMIQNAVANHQWLVLTFHDIDTKGDQYSTTPQDFREIVDYVKSHNIPVVTVSEGASQLSRQSQK